MNSNQTLLNRMGGMSRLNDAITILHDRLSRDECLRKNIRPVDVRKFHSQIGSAILKVFGSVSPSIAASEVFGAIKLISITQEEFTIIGRHAIASLIQIEMDTLLIKESMDVYMSIKNFFISG